MKLDISELVPAFPAFRVAALVATGMRLSPERAEELDDIIAAREAAVRRAWGGRELGAIPGINAWRLAYKAFGIKKTKYRCSVERLVKNALAGRPLPAINGFVDAYNAVSMTHVLPIGADDVDKVAGDLAFRYARDGDSFLDMSGGEEANGDGEDSDNAPKPGEVIFADGSGKALCRRWNWRQDARSLVSAETTRAVMTIQSLGVGELDAAIADAMALIERFSAGKVSVTVLDAKTPVANLAGT
ncbi:MAG: phenylalanine--tRNA ligase beta subunit-related protein [Ancalomicrobiaceae bacterium]|nr:phenylalanine--tRNA ligase beta subunit-related protein [Ancalomicrobiaceae bacterium]